MAVDDEVLDAIVRAYGSLERPNFAQVAERLDQQPYADLVDSVAGQFEVEETTDTNDDHAFVYTLARDDRAWSLALSAVGPYAVFARISDAWDEILTPTSPDLDEYERWLMYQLTRAGLHPLRREDLERPVGLALYNTEPGAVRVYHALFTDTPGLPWDKDELRRLGLI
jgi:hypothetical protein